MAVNVNHTNQGQPLPERCHYWKEKSGHPYVRRAAPS